MPNVSKIIIEDFRNISAATLHPSPSANIIYGENGSGKTSLLESIAVLAHGKSFRSHRVRHLIKEGESAFTLFAQLDETSMTNRLGVSKSLKGDSQIRIDGKPASSSAELAKRLPLLVMTNSSFSLLEGGPKVRRQFFDWLVFHVEHGFIEAWRNYSRCLKQRNMLLRHDKIDYSQVRPWDQEIAKLSRLICALRKNVFSDYLTVFSSYIGTYPFGSRVNFELLTGWPENDLDEEEVLFKNFHRDCKLGYTQFGCHRSDIRIRVGRTSASDILSRGQQKLLITALYLSAAKRYIQAVERIPLFLIDDIAAELDPGNIQLLSEQIGELGSQIFLTAVDKTATSKFWIAADHKPAMFHVEHGRILDL